eukprot:6501819-Lingulodinium_polyedra.AAC.1
MIEYKHLVGANIDMNMIEYEHLLGAHMIRAGCQIGTNYSPNNPLPSGFEPAPRKDPGLS